MRWVSLVLIVAAAGIVAWSLGGRPRASSDADRRSQSSRPGSPSAPPGRPADRSEDRERDAGDPSSSDSRVAGRDDSPSRHGVVLAASEALTAEDPDHARWNAMSADERIASLEAELARAMADARAGGPDAPAARSRAETTLSTLRADLWPSPVGRARYLRFESALDELEELNTKRGAR